MDYIVSVPQIVYALVALSLLVLIIFKTRREDRLRRAPEASGGWPLIGHLHRLAVREPPHQVFGDMADKYDPIFYIKLGRKPNLVISSWEIVKECFSTNDKVFLERPYNAAISHSYDGPIFELGQRSGQYWHNIRRITSHELLSTTKLDLLQKDRLLEVKICIKHLFTSSCHATPTKVDMSEWSSLVCMNVTTRMVVGTSFDPNKKDWQRFVKSTRDFMNLMIKTFVISDVVPFTERMDLQGNFKSVERAIKECDRFITCCLDEHVRKRKEGKINHDKDFVDVMLTILENDPSLSTPHLIEVPVKSTILGLIIGGVDTMESAIKWAFSLLVNHLEILKEVQNEIDTHIGKKWIKELDMRNFTYLVAVIKETLRLAMPLNVPRESTEDCTIAGYHIPKGTNLIINVWKLHRDPRVWSYHDKFQPERFLNGNVGVHIDERDKKFMFIPLSVGRKSCFGMTLAMQMMLLVMSRVLQGFDLATPDGQKVDMTEGLGSQTIWSSYSRLVFHMNSTSYVPIIHEL